MVGVLLQHNHNESSKKVYNAWSEFITKGKINSNIIRPEVLNSWKRSKEYSVDPFQLRVNKLLSYDQLKSVRNENDFLLSVAEPKMEKLANSLYGTDAVVTLADKNGVIFNTFGDVSILTKSEEIGLVPGSIWNEKVAGTNVVGIVLSQKKPIQVLYTEHFSTGWHDWSSNAAPIYHPLTNELIGVFDIAGVFKNVNRHTLELAISKTKLISNLIINDIYQDGLNKNPYLNTLFQTLDDSMLIINTNKEVIKMNSLMGTILKQEGIENILEIEEINELIDYILKHRKPFVQSDVTLSNTKSRYLCKVYPVFIDLDISGIIIQFKKLNQKANSINYKKYSSYRFDDILGNSEALKKQIELAKKAAQIDTTLFISGESGTGKELFAQAIHHASDRRNGPFVAVNCGAIPDNLITSELFGYEGGSFTGADTKGKKGKFEQANAGTIFLDEIGDMPLDAQVQLLRALDEKVIMRVGGQQPIHLDIRIIAATHKNLLEEVKQGRFRNDLYYRIQGIQLCLPPLRDRAEDILLLANYYIKELSSIFNKKHVKLSEDASSYLLEYNWPGNIRKLKNTIQQALFNLDDEVIFPRHLPEHICSSSSKQKSEKDKIIEAIKKENGHMTSVANRLNISRATLYRKLKQYQLSKSSVFQEKNDS